MARTKRLSDTERYRRNLAAFLKSAGMTQGQLAKRSGVSYVTVSRFLTGKLSKPSLELCEKLSAGAGTTTAKLLDS